MLAAPPGLVQADDAGQDDADRDRYVHVCPSGPQGGERRPEERLAGIGHGGKRDRGRQEVEQLARGGAHRAVMAGPDGDRQQHDVGRGEARDGQRAQQRPRFAVLGTGGRDHVVGGRPEAERCHQADMLVGGGGRAAPGERQAPGRQMHARAQHVGMARQQALDQPHAGGAVEAVDQQFELALAGPPFADMGREVAVQRDRAVGAALVQPAVEGAEPGRADDGVGAGAAGAAEGRVGGQAHRFAAMATQAARGEGRRRRKEGGVAHRRNIRRVSAYRCPPKSTTMSTSQLPRAGRIARAA